MGRTLVERAEEAPRVSRPGAMTPDLTIGVVGPHDLVERVMLMGHAAAPLPCRLVAAAYRDEQEAADKVTRLGPGVDACLFASPVPYDLARRSGVLTMPATYVQLGGAALVAALARAALDERHRPARVSIDVLSRADVEEAYADLEPSASGMCTAATSRAPPARSRPSTSALPAQGSHHGRAHLPARGRRTPAGGRRPGDQDPARPPRRSVRRCTRRRCSARTTGWRSPSSPWCWSRCRRSASRYAGPRRVTGATSSGCPCTGCWSRRRNRINAAVWPHRRPQLPGHRDPRLDRRGHRRLPGAAVRRPDPRRAGSGGRGRRRHGTYDPRRRVPRPGRAGPHPGGQAGPGLRRGPRGPGAGPRAADARRRARAALKPKGVEVLARLAAKLEGGDTVVDAESAGKMLGVTPAYGPAAAAHVGRRGTRVAASAEPHASAGPSAPALPPDRGEARATLTAP